MPDEPLGFRQSKSDREDVPVDETSGNGFALIPCTRIENMQESARCVRTANGEIMFEFWLQSRPDRSVRIDADAYLDTLERLRAAPQEDSLFSSPGRVTTKVDLAP